MSVLSNLFDHDKVFSSSVPEDKQRVVNYGPDGQEFITYEKIDYKKVLDSHGSVSDWSLQSLLKAGIDPAFPIRTGLATRLEGVSTVNEAAAMVDSLLSETSNAE